MTSDTTIDEFVDIELTSASATDPDLLVAPLERDMGSDPDLSTKKIQIRIGRRPRAYSLRALYEVSGREYPAQLKLDTAYRVWLIAVTASVVRYDGFEDVKYLGLEIRFPEEPRVTVQGLAPQTQFVDRLKVDTETRFSAAVEVRTNGEMELPEAVLDAVQLGTGFSIGAAAGAKLHASTRADVVGQLSFTVASAVVQSVGIGDHRCEWVLKRHKAPLVGDHVFVVTLLVPEMVEPLAFEARVGATITTFDLLSDTLVTPWVCLESTVPRGQSLE